MHHHDYEGGPNDDLEADPSYLKIDNSDGINDKELRRAPKSHFHAKRIRNILLHLYVEILVQHTSSIRALVVRHYSSIQFNLIVFCFICNCGYISHIFIVVVLFISSKEAFL